MRYLTFAVGFVAMALLSPPVTVSADRPTKSATPLSEDEIAIYKAVLWQYASDESRSLNVSSKTYPLDPESHMNGLRNGECLKGIQLDNLAAISHTYHELPPEVLSGKNMRLVDPEKQAKIVKSNDPDRTMAKGKSVDNAVKDAFATGLFSISEIAFDKDHRYAAVSYSFWCGGLCGHGSTLVFQKAGSEWKKMERNCGGWIS